MTIQTKTRRKGGRLAGMVRLGRTLGHYHVSALLNCFTHQKLELAGFIPTRRHTSAIISLDPNSRPAKFFGQTVHRLQSGRQMSKVYARESGKVHVSVL
jgi:hypothetical protein